MSQVAWKKALVPGAHEPIQDFTCSLYEHPFIVKRTRSIGKKEEEIVELPDRRAYRSMSRAAVLLSAVGLEAKPFLEPYLSKNKFGVGVYCAVEQGPTPYDCVKQMVHTTPEEFGETYKKLRTPKQYLRQLPNLAPAQMGIFLEIMGPLNVYHHSKAGCLHALEQAEYDLANSIVDAALVCTAFSLEDPLIVMRTRRESSEDQVITEGAAAVLLVPSAKPTNWTHEEHFRSNDYFGIANPLIHISLEGGDL